MASASNTQSDRISTDASGVSFQLDVRRTAVSSARAVGFWTAVGLPFLYLPLLVGGLSGQESIALAVLLVANSLALYLGHGHVPRNDRESGQ